MSNDPPGPWERPEGVDEQHLEYLDELQASGRTNMFGGARYLVTEQYVTIKQARTILKYWMESYEERH